MSLEEIKKYQEQVELGYIRQVTQGDLILFNYTDHCTFDKHWNEYTKNARGIIFNQKTGDLVAKPFPKFFNLGEMSDSTFKALPNEEYEVFEKVDGSLGIIYFYDNKWNLATRGSFTSEQAIKGTELLYKYDLSKLITNTTYLVEIIYPENKIVVNYGHEEKLVLLGAYYTKDRRELSDDYVELISHVTSMPLANKYNFTIEEMVALQKTIPKDKEGFVVRFKSGFRVKIKGEEYLRIHKMIANMSPLSFWEAMTDGIVNKDYLVQLPEEYKKDFEPMVENLEAFYKQVYNEIVLDTLYLPTTDTSNRDNLKAIGLFVKDSTILRHPGAMFPFVLRNKEALNKYIMKAIRPTGNMLKS